MVKNKITIRSSNLTPRCISKMVEIRIFKGYLHYQAYEVIHSSHDMETIQVSIPKSMDKYIDILEQNSPLIRKKVLSFVISCIDLKDIMLNMRSLLEKEKETKG